jgi:hypothetical protein
VEYCALDNPIKNYFGLSKESFFLAFIIISSEYKHWAEINTDLIRTMSERLKQLDRKQVMNYEKITVLKWLDLVFWSRANPD